MKLTDEVIDKMLTANLHGRATDHLLEIKTGSPSTWSEWRSRMRRAAEVLVPLVIEEALGNLSDEEIGATSNCGWSKYDYDLVRIIFANRKAGLTALVDPAKDAVKAVTDKYFLINKREDIELFYAEVVAAVDAARAKP